MIPGLEKAEFVRLGSLHRKYFVNSLISGRPAMARRSTLSSPDRYRVEGYIESAQRVFGRHQCRKAVAERNRRSADNGAGSALALHHDRGQAISADERQLRLDPSLPAKVPGKAKKEMLRGALADMDLGSSMQ